VRIRFWGVRGTLPVPGQETVKYGGNTACIDVLTSDQQVIIIDAGTGVRNLGRTLLEEHQQRVSGTILLSHTHWDHIQGLPFFDPLLSRHNRFTLYGRKRIGKSLEEVLAGQFFEPYLPFAYRSLSASFNVREVTPGETIYIGENTTVTTADLFHPGGCLGFRIQDNGTVLTYCTDNGHDGLHFSNQVLALVQNSDLLVHDAHFPSWELSKTFAEWGHSSWYEAVHLAREANVKALGLFHYGPDLREEELDRIQVEASSHFSRTIMAREGLILQLPLGPNLPD